MINTGLSVPINGVRFPMVFVDYRFAYCDAVFGLDDRRNDLLEQVSECAKKLKRYDYQKIILVKLKMEDPDLILNIAKWFEEEDIETLCVYSDRIDYTQCEKLYDKFKYGVINSWFAMAEYKKEENMQNNNDSYKKSL